MYNLIILGDWNTIREDLIEQWVTGNFELGNWNQKSERIIKFCKCVTSYHERGVWTGYKVTKAQQISWDLWAK